VVAGMPRVAATGASLFALGSLTALQQYLRLVLPGLRARTP